MKMIGKVEIPQEALLAALQIGDDQFSVKIPDVVFF